MTNQLSTHFMRSEFACRDGCGFDEVHSRLIDGLEKIRLKTGPIGVLSGCRCEKRNASEGGAKLSQHLLGKAADIQIAGMTSREIYAIARTIPEFNGFGVSDHEDFLHVDVRDGPMKRWCYNASNQQVPWYEGTAAAPGRPA